MSTKCKCDDSGDTMSNEAMFQVLKKVLGGSSQQQNTNPCAGNGSGMGYGSSGKPYCLPSLVSAATEANIRSQPRTTTTELIPGGGILAGGVVVVLLASNGLARAVSFVDLVSLLQLDVFHIVVSVSGVVKLDFFGGRFGRTNANPCTTSCGLSVCAGPIEDVVITITNEGADIAGTSKAKLQTTVAYQGEDAYNAACGDCEPMASSGSSGGSGTVEV